ncbi:uncharacterized protein DFL_001202 [Arthrobotrys flagrans]|uniref:Uncharacterized protein n=1 Tax=Arthrobotrys flagrans TaxID=97331 RepID=A0A437AGG8_ARTFL|nr:hypothetical protein DFL_001202 [Arthrobotrys flagrans]
MSTSTSTTKTLTPVASDEYIIVLSPSTTATEAVDSKTLSRQKSTSSDERSLDFASVKNSREAISNPEPAITTVENDEAKSGETVTDIPSPKEGRGIANPPPHQSLRTVPGYLNLRTKIPRETKLVAGLPIIWAKTGDPKHDLQLFDRVYLGKEDPNKTSF